MSSTSSSQSTESPFSHNYATITKIINSGLIEERDNPYRNTDGIPMYPTEETIYNYIIEYVTLTAIANINEMKNPDGSKMYKYLQIPDNSYVEKRQAKLKKIFEAHKNNLQPSKVSDNLKPYLSYIADFENNLISLPDHKNLLLEIIKLLTTNPHNAARYLSAGVLGKKRKGGRRKTQYRLLRKTRKGKTRSRGKKRSH